MAPAWQCVLRVMAPLLAVACTVAAQGPGAATEPNSAPPPTVQPAATPSMAPVTARLRKSAERSFQRGAAALRDRHFDRAEEDFAAAVRDDPTQPRFYQALLLARESHVTDLVRDAAGERTAHPLAAERLMAEARGVDPQNPRVTQRDASTAARSPSQRQAEPLRFVPAEEIVPKPNGATRSFHEQTDTAAFAQELGSAYGLRVAVDTELQSRSFRIDADNADYRTALSLFGILGNVFATPLDEHSILIAADTTANRKRLEHLLQQTIPMPGYSTEQINETGNMLRTVFELDQRQVQTSPLLNSLVLRAPADTLHAADAILADLIDSGREVTIEVKLYSVDTTKVRNLGVVLPTSFTLFSARSELQKILNNNSSLIQQLIASGALPSAATPAQIAAYLVFVAGLGSGTNLQNTFFVFGGGLSSLTSNSNSGIGITPVGISAGSFPSLNFALQKSDARALDDLQLRVADRTSATFKAGARYPIQTSIYSDIASSATSNSAISALLAKYLGTTNTSSLTSSIIPQFQYEDLGLTVNATPRVLNETDVAIKLEIKISALAGTALNGIPVLASRQFSSTFTVEDGQTIVMASHLQDSELASVTGVPGLSSIPGLGNLTNRSTNDSHTNLVLLVTPHIVRHSHDLAKGPLVPLEPRPDDN